MSVMRPTLFRALLLSVLAVSAVVVPSVGAAEFETPPVLRTADLVDEKLLEGPNYKLDAEVKNDGYMNHFEIRSDFGDFQARSELILSMRIREVYALAKLAEISQSEAFADALGAAATGMATTAVNVVSHPVGTAKGVGAGINRKFKGYKYKGKKIKHQADDKVAEQKEEKAADEGEAADGGEAAPDKEKASTTEMAEGAAKNFLGWNKTKRQLAASLQVDPYTDNEVLQAELDRVAKGAFAANLGVRFGMPSIPGMKEINKANDLVWSLPPEELERLNDVALKEAGVEEAMRLDFFANPHWSPSLETVLVQALAGMGTTAGREAVVEVAIQSDSRLTSYIFSLMAKVLHGHHVLVEPIAEIRLLGNFKDGHIAVGISESGKLIVPLAFDYLIWKEEMTADGPAYEFAEREIWSAGRMSERCRAEWEKRGWTVHTRVLGPWQKELEAREAAATKTAEAEKQG